MSLLDLPVDERVNCLCELLACRGNLFRWVYDAQGTLLDTNCDEITLNALLNASESMRYMLEHGQTNHEPLVLSNDYGLMWGAAFEYAQDELARIHVLGPVFSSDTKLEKIAHVLSLAEMPRTWVPKLTRNLKSVPQMMVNQFFQDVLMLHYCITGEMLSAGDIVFQRAAGQQERKDDTPKGDRMQTYMTEQALLRMVRDGNLDYKPILDKAATISLGVGVTSVDSLVRAKTTSAVFISLCTRAAIEGGISPEVAYSRGDAYIQDVLDCRTITDVVYINHRMYEDFIRLVHKGRSNPGLTKQIQSCCDYIELHLDEKLTLSDLARRIGYAEYYLSRKFKEETGVSINNYIKIARVERAKLLLTTTQLSIQQISEQLCFGTRSFFDDTFKKIVGTAPAAYRAENQRL